jgi:polar amino acid transport system substrate-binding protein
MRIAGKVTSLSQVLDIQNGYFAFPHGAAHAELRARFDIEFNGMVSSGELAKIARRYSVHIP